MTEKRATGLARRGVAALVMAAFAATGLASDVRAQSRTIRFTQTVPAGLEMHVRMEAVVLSDDDGGNPSGVLGVAQLRDWLGVMNAALEAAGAHIHIDFNPHTDLDHVHDSILNRLDHDSNARAAQLASHYPGQMVVLFRAYGPAGSGLAVTGNGYTAYNAYVPLGSKDCKSGTEGACSASYTVLPSVYCATLVSTDLVKPGQTNGPLGPDRSGCGVTNGSTYTYQNFSQFAHEGGHYLGLPHTFPGSYDFLSSPGALKNWYQGTPRAGTTRSLRRSTAIPRPARSSPTVRT